MPYYRTRDDERSKIRQIGRRSCTDRLVSCDSDGRPSEVDDEPEGTDDASSVAGGNESEVAGDASSTADADESD